MAGNHPKRNRSFFSRQPVVNERLRTIFFLDISTEMGTGEGDPRPKQNPIFSEER